jgi:aspartate kinase
MKVYKFGGASVKDGGGIRNLARIVSGESDNLVVVISAFGKTTNALEKVLSTWLQGDDLYKSLLDELYRIHNSIIDEIFPDRNTVAGKIDISFACLEEYLSSEKRKDYDFVYDQIVSYGEIWSTLIVVEYLKLNISDV